MPASLLIKLPISFIHMPMSFSHARSLERRVLTTILFRMALLAIVSVAAVPSRAAEAPPGRALLVQAILAEDAAQQVELVKKLVDANEPIVAQALTAWRGGSVYIHETNGAISSWCAFRYVVAGRRRHAANHEKGFTTRLRRCGVSHAQRAA